MGGIAMRKSPKVKLTILADVADAVVQGRMRFRDEVDAINPLYRLPHLPRYPHKRAGTEAVPWRLRALVALG
jgi:hypothetical protein